MNAAPPPWPRFLPDLTLWHHWHASCGTLPDRWKAMELSRLCRTLGVPFWHTVRPWREELPGVRVHDTRGKTERMLVWETAQGTLTSRWTLGPDGDWWRAEYPVKGPDDLAAALTVARSRRYIVKPEFGGHGGEDALPALELPLRPWSELFHAFLGWSEGLMLLLEEPRGVREIAQALEESLEGLVDELARLPGRLMLSPDNLDAQFITPAAFEENLAASYRRAADAVHAAGKLLVVHVGGPVRQLLPALAGSGVDCIEGICGAPQGDTTLAEARALCNPDIVLWGGIAQDYLLSGRTQVEFETAVESAFSDAAGDPGAVVGIADKVPTNALPERLEELSRMAAEHFGG
jgi:hypothetical protein